jgi:hypothetical protein
MGDFVQPGGGTATSPSGLRDIPALAYHADAVADVPTLSKSILHTLIERSPAHAREQHPKLNPDFQRVDEDKFDLGTAAHSLFLEGEAGVHVVYADDWRTRAAKDERDLARAHGRIPMLAKHYADVEKMVTSVRSQLEAFDVDPPLFSDGAAERTIVWDENGVLCRARLDWLRDDLLACDDLKTTRASASPEQWRRIAFNIGADVQAALYGRGIRAVTGHDPQFRFVVCETVSPFAVSVVELDEVAVAVGNAKVDRALEIWGDCLETGIWPAFARQVVNVTAPPWELRWLDNHEEFEEAAWAQM